MSQHRRRPLPKIVCQAEDRADFGYGDTEYYPCAAPATHKMADPYPNQVSNEVMPKIALCARHAAGEAKAYRFRVVAA